MQACRNTSKNQLVRIIETLNLAKNVKFPKTIHKTVLLERLRIIENRPSTSGGAVRRKQMSYYDEAIA